MIRVGVVDDHPMFRDGVIHTLRAQPGIEVVASGATAEDAIRISRDFKPDVIVLDMNMPGDGIAALEAISAGEHPVSTLMLTVVSDEERACGAIRKGAKGYVLKGIGGAELVRAVCAVYQGENYITPTLAAHLLNHLGRTSASKPPKPAVTSGLSSREEEILTFIAEGLSNKEIGIRLDLSDKTVKHYVTGVLQKLRVRNRVEAAIVATRRTREPHNDSGIRQASTPTNDREFTAGRMAQNGAPAPAQAYQGASGLAARNGIAARETIDSSLMMPLISPHHTSRSQRHGEPRQ